MSYKITTDAEAYAWLLKNVYQKGKGEFRIHTNKKGIRLYLDFSNPDILGSHFEWKGFGSYMEKLTVHPDAKILTPNYYRNSVVAGSLVECLNAHLEHHDSILKEYPYPKTFTEFLHSDIPHYLSISEFKGTLEEFVAAHNEHQERTRHNNYHNIDVSLFT